MVDYDDRLERAADKAAYAGNLPELIRLRDREGYRFDSDWHCIVAAAGGHLEVLQWLRENGCPCNDRAIQYAAERGHLAVLRWLVDNGCPWSNYACSAAAKNGHLDVLVWMYENGGPFGENLVGDAVHENCREFWEAYAIPHWSRGEHVPVSPISPAPKPAKK